MARAKGCPACRADAAQNHARKVEAWEARVEAVNWWREFKGREPLEFNRWSYPDLFGYGAAAPDANDVEVCARVFGGKVGYWEKPIGFAAELKRALSRPSVENKRRRRDGTYPALNYSLPLPSLAASGKRLANAELVLWTETTEMAHEWTGRRYEAVERTGRVRQETFTGPKAAEQYIAHRRAELGLGLVLEAV